MAFSNDIQAIRKRLFLSQEDFAKEIGVAFSTVNRWEAGKSSPNYKTMRKFSEYCSKHNISFDTDKYLFQSKEDTE